MERTHPFARSEVWTDDYVMCTGTAWLGERCEGHAERLTRMDKATTIIV